MKKALIMIDQYDEIKQATDALKLIAERASQRFEFLKKSAKDIVEQSNKEGKAHWAVITKKLQDLGKIPLGEEGEKTQLHFSEEQNLIYMSDGAPSNPLEAIRDLIGGIIKVDVE